MSDDAVIGGLFTVNFDENGVAIFTGDVLLDGEFFIDEETDGVVYQQDYDAPLELQALGGGQIAYYDPTGDVGVFISNGDGTFMTFGSVLNSQPFDAHVLALPDGGTVTLFETNPGDVDTPLALSIAQTDVIGNTLEVTEFDFAPPRAAWSYH